MDYETSYKNPELYKNVIQFVKSGFSLLEDSLNNIIRIRDEKSIIDHQDPVRKMTGYKEEEILEDRMFVYQYTKILVDSNKKALEDIDEFKECLSTINNDQIIAEKLRDKQIVVLGVIYRLSPGLFFMHILTRCLYSYVITKSMDLSLLYELYNDFERFLFEQTITVMTLSAIKGFTSYDSGLDLIQLSDNISIRRLSLDEKIAIYQRGVPSQMLPPRANWVIEYKSIIEKNLNSNPRIEEGFDSKMIDSIFASVITAMRLFQEGLVGINSFIHYIPLNVPIYTFYISGLDIMGLDTDSTSYYLFDKNKSADFIKLWNTFGDSLTKVLDFRIYDKDPYNNIKNAVHRFNYAYQRRTGEDSVVDYVVALEALLSSNQDGNTDSIRYRISLRAAKLLEDNPAKRSERFNEVKKMYDRRSSIVHGNRSVENYNLISIHDTVCDSIKKYLMLLKDSSHDQIISSLDYG